MGRTAGGHLTAMGGCQAYIGGSESCEDSPDVGRLKLKNNNWKAEHSPEEKAYLRDACLSQLLGSTEVQTLCLLPEGLDKAEWMASHTFCLFKHINLISSALSEFCTSSTCPIASGPGGMTFYWTDECGKKVRCSAPLYADYAMSYVQQLLSDENVFPTKADRSFPKGYVFLVQRIFLYMFHMLAHLYWAHFMEVVQLKMHPHLNTLFHHLVTFGHEFQLLESAEIKPLEDMFSTLLHSQDP